MKRLRVLISSHEFSPDQGSECAVGWNIATRMAAYHDVTLLCADGPPLYENSYRNAVTRYFERHGEIPGFRVVYVKQPPRTLWYARLNRRLMKFTRGIGWQPLYYQGLDSWHREAFRTAQNLDLDNFDAVHQLTPISFLKPGYLWTSNVPFFWGPIGGMFKVPGAFSRRGGISTFLFETFRACNITWQISRSRSFRDTVLKAKRIWAITDDELRIVNAIAEDKVVAMIESAPPAGITGKVRQYDGIRPLRLCWSGHHEARKALPLLLDALAGFPDQGKVVLDVLGEGPATKRWQDMARRMGLGEIRWHGRLPYHEALKTMDQADVFIHSSIREGTPHVVLEALSWGMPVICHEACGMAVAVDGTCGIKVPFENPERSVKGFRDAIDRLIRRPELVEQLSAGALRRASALSWDAKVKEIAEAYEQCAGSRCDASVQN